MLTAKQSHPFRFSLIFIMSLLLVTVLAACGDSPTAVPATTTAAATTTAVTATTAATTTAVTTTTAASVTSTSSDFSLPKFDNLKEITLGSEIEGIITTGLPPNVIIKLYGAMDDAKTVAASLDSTLAKASFVKEAPNGSTSTTLPNGVVASYNAGNNSLILSIGPIPTDAAALSKGLNLPGLSADGSQKLYEQLKAYKSLVALIGFSGVTSSTPAATTAASGSSAPTLPNFDNLKELTFGSEVVGAINSGLPGDIIMNVGIKFYGVMDDAKTIATSLDATVGKTSFVKEAPNSSISTSIKSIFPDGVTASYQAGGKFLVLTVVPVPPDASGLAKGTYLNGFCCGDAQKVYEQLKDYKSLVVMFVY